MDRMGKMVGKRDRRGRRRGGRITERGGSQMAGSSGQPVVSPNMADGYTVILQLLYRMELIIVNLAGIHS